MSRPPNILRPGIRGVELPEEVIAREEGTIKIPGRVTRVVVNEHDVVEVKQESVVLNRGGCCPPLSFLNLMGQDDQWRPEPFNGASFARFVYNTSTFANTKVFWGAVGSGFPNSTPITAGLGKIHEVFDEGVVLATQYEFKVVASRPLCTDSFTSDVYGFLTCSKVLAGKACDIVDAIVSLTTFDLSSTLAFEQTLVTCVLDTGAEGVGPCSLTLDVATLATFSLTSTVLGSILPTHLFTAVDATTNVP